jgi:RNA polymerase sigma factor (sigma-70 family)
LPSLTPFGRPDSSANERRTAVTDTDGMGVIGSAARLNRSAGPNDLDVPTGVTATAGYAAAPDRFTEWARPSLLAMTRLARRLAPEHEPEDIVQDALMRAWQKRDQFDADRGSATTWLLAITADRAREARRARVRRLRLVDDRADVPDPPSPPSDHEADLDLDRAIDRLAERQQLAVHLHYFLGLSVDETAAVMACSAGTVKSTLFDARARLRLLLGDDDES